MITKEIIKELCEKYGIENYTINKDMSIYVNDNVDLSNKGLTKLPLKFDVVNGTFNCSNNELDTLEGSPSRCTFFICSNNNLTDLHYAPRNCEYFDCENNNLDTLEGLPRCEYITCDYMNLTDIDSEEKYIIDAMIRSYGNNLQNYLKIKKRNKLIDFLLE